MEQLKQTWRPPDTGWLKVNSDGAVSKVSKNGGGGAVIRDEDGAFRAGLSHCFRGVDDPESVEILACKRALEVAKEINAEKVHVELDSQGVARMLNNHHKELSSAGPWMQEIKSMLTSFSEFKVSWVRRSANITAHKLAKVGVGDELRKVWLGIPPARVLDVILDEIPNAYN